jgi:glycosyltransferase involved in cell wall biosynthesis
MDIDYSIIIPAYNEEAVLEYTLDQLKMAMSTVLLQGEIIVADNNSTDRTAEIARNAGAMVAFEPINQISRARNAGAKQARGRYLVFIDADTVIPPKLLQTALQNLESDQCCGGGATVTMDADIQGVAKKMVNTWNALSKRFQLAAGCFVYVRREDFEACGGFSESVYASEEIWLSRCLKRHSKNNGRVFRIITEPSAITSGRKLLWHGYAYQVVLILTLILFPFMTRFKWACGFWYKRPNQ